MNTMEKLRELEAFMGFSIDRMSITAMYAEPYDEKFYLMLYNRFYGREEELSVAINKTTLILFKSNGLEKRKLSLCYSLLGNMYYIKGDFDRSTGCFMRALSLDKQDFTEWIELVFSLRSLGEFEIFEDLIFNIEKIYEIWLRDESTELTKEKILQLIKSTKEVRSS